jgi:photosystem II stability/assembly factor-like uncharacterized protein
MEKENSKLLEKLTTYLFYLSILLFLIAFNFQDSRSGGWYQQFLPNLNGRSISDITFLDSLTGYAVTPYIANDTAYVIKTTNGGDNWFILSRRYNLLQRVQFLNLNTGFVCGSALLKTTNQGLNWLPVNTSGISAEGMWVISYDTIWIIDQESLTGGAFLTTNGGVSWVQKYSAGSLNPDKIYFYNSRIGFIGYNGGTRYIAKTTNAGDSWTTFFNNDYFQDMYFYDSLLGWKSSVFGMKKTTNGGLNWITQTLPSGGNIYTSGVSYFSNINKDTIWATGSNVLYPGNQLRGILLRTTNQGSNWFFQIPDTSFHISGYWFIKFTNKLNGWATMLIHTKTGGDTTFFSGIQQINTQIPKAFELKQNYPNPFNSRTIINFNLKKAGYVRLYVYDITGKEVQKMVDNRQQAGEYNVDFMGKFAPSGVYFYRMEVTDEKTNRMFTDTKKMIQIK